MSAVELATPDGPLFEANPLRPSSNDARPFSLPVWPVFDPKVEPSSILTRQVRVLPGALLLPQPGHDREPRDWPLQARPPGWLPQQHVRGAPAGAVGHGLVHGLRCARLHAQHNFTAARHVRTLIQCIQCALLARSVAFALKSQPASGFTSRCWPTQHSCLGAE